MQVKRKELLELLSKLKPGLSTKGIIEQMGHFIFLDERIFSYNDRICLSVEFKSDFEFSVSADLLYGLLSRIEDEVVEVSCRDSILKIEGKIVSSELATSSEQQVFEVIDSMELSKERDWRTVPSGFVEGIQSCLFSASKDVSNVLSGISVTNEAIVSSDDMRITEFKFEGMSPFILPLSSALELVGYDFDQYFLEKVWVFFRNKQTGIFFCCRLLEGEFPDISGHFEFEGQEINLPEKFSLKIETVSICAEGEFNIDKKIDIEIGGNKVRCRGEREEGWVECNLDVEYEGDAIKFGINPLFLLDILKRTDKMKIGVDRGLFQAENFRHLIALYGE